jgi:hypothetical protein
MISKDIASINVACFAVLLLSLLGCRGEDKQPLTDSVLKLSSVPIRGKLKLITAVPRGGKPELNYEIYEFSSDGHMTQHPASTPGERSPLGSHMDDCQEKVPSPDNNFVVSCITTTRSPFRPLRFTVDDANGKQIMVIPVEEPARIDGIAWAPDSKLIAVLVQGERYGKGPFDLLSALTGHPVPYTNYSVRVYAMDSTMVLSVPNVVKNLAYGRGALEWARE